jgi:hypothetical protein
MNIRNRTVLGWALGGFTFGTAMSTIYACSGGSLLELANDWAHVAIFPGILVGYQAFDLVGYSAAVSLACLTVGLVYSGLASAVGSTVGRVGMISRRNLERQSLRRPH